MYKSSFLFWLTILLSGAVTFFIRFFFIQFIHDNLSQNTKELLSFIPPAVLSALVAGSVFTEGASSVTFSSPYLWASLTALIVVIKFKNILLTIAAGMAVIWLWNFVIA